MKLKRASYTLAMLISMGVGIWHSSVPYLYDWYGYLAGIPDILRVSIDWINFFFSLFLVGYSILLLIVRKEFFNGDRVARIFYYFFLAVWISRVVITVFHNWGWNEIVAGYIAAFAIECILLIIPMINIKEK